MAERQRRVESVIERLLLEGTIAAQEAGSRHDPMTVAVSDELGSVLRSRVRTEKAAATIEVGLGFGVSALYICAGLLDTGLESVRHVAIDPFQSRSPDGVGFAGIGLRSLVEAGVEAMVEHIEQESQIALPALVVGGRAFDLGFIDGNHRFERVFLDLYYLGRLVRPGGVIILDDFEFPGIAKAVSFFTHNLNWRIEDARTEGPHGWAIVRTTEEEDKRHFTDFADF